LDDSLYQEMAQREKNYWWFVAKRHIILRLIERYVQAGPAKAAGDESTTVPSICDIGCGTGALLMALKDRYRVTGTDSSAIAREICAKAGITTHDGTLPDALPFEPASFDCIVMSDVLEHVGPDTESVAAAARLLRPRGVLICTVPAHQWMWTRRDEFHHHKRRYSRGQFGRLFDQAGLQTEVLSYYNALLFPVMIAGRLGKKLLGLDKAHEDIRPLPGLVNGALRWTFEVEKWVLPYVRIPMGASLVSVHRKA